jgi:hypothetical protein
MEGCLDCFVKGVRELAQSLAQLAQEGNQEGLSFKGWFQTRVCKP